MRPGSSRASEERGCVRLAVAETDDGAVGAGGAEGGRDGARGAAEPVDDLDGSDCTEPCAHAIEVKRRCQVAAEKNECGAARVGARLGAHGVVGSLIAASQCGVSCARVR